MRQMYAVVKLSISLAFSRVRSVFHIEIPKIISWSVLCMYFDYMLLLQHRRIHLLIYFNSDMMNSFELNLFTDIVYFFDISGTNLHAFMSI